MKALSYRREGVATYGLLVEGTVREASPAFRARYPDLRAVLAGGVLEGLPDHLGGDSVPEGAVEYLPVIPQPDKILCVGVNYRPHAQEMGRDLPPHPLLFVRFPGAQVGHRQSLVKPSLSEQYDYEGELALVIGRRAWRVNEADAFDVVAGYTCFMDGSVRDWQKHTSQFTAGKNFRASGAAGPWLVTPDEIGDPAALTLETRVSGETLQEGRLTDLVFGIPALIAYCSAFTELLPGDLLVTGTPAGVGAGRRPPRWLKPGDCVEVDIGPVGTLRNTVVAE